MVVSSPDQLVIRKTVIDMLCGLKIRIVFLYDTYISGNDITKGKPDPQIFLMAVERLRVEPQECIVFEDAETEKVTNRFIVIVVAEVVDHDTWKGIRRYNITIHPDVKVILLDKIYEWIGDLSEDLADEILDIYEINRRAI